MDRRSIERRIGRVALVAGLVLTLFLLFESVLTGLVESRSQRTLLQEFRAGVPTKTLGSMTKVPPDGAPVALLGIPQLGLRAVVVQGSSPERTKEGPGHLPGTPLPGEFGNSVILGRRLTYGAPFRHLDRMQTGDEITAITGQGFFTYRVTSVSYLEPGQPDVTGPSLDSRLTLVTAGPSAVPSTRLAVVAKLEGNPLGVPNRPSVAVAPDEFGQTGNVTGLFAAVLWAAALGLVLVLAVRLYRRLPFRTTWVLTTPLVLLLLWLIFENLDRVLPGTL
jgi:sortase A